MDEQDDLTEQKGEVLTLKGKNVACPICGRDHFTERVSLLNTRGATFFHLDWANKEAYNYICTHCGYVLWFVPQ